MLPLAAHTVDHHPSPDCILCHGLYFCVLHKASLNGNPRAFNEVLTGPLPDPERDQCLYLQTGGWW